MKTRVFRVALCQCGDFSLPDFLKQSCASDGENPNAGHHSSRKIQWPISFGKATVEADADEKKRIHEQQHLQFVRLNGILLCPQLKQLAVDLMVFFCVRLLHLIELATGCDYSIFRQCKA